MVTKILQSPFNGGVMLNGDQIFFNHQKGMGVGHEMTIKTRGGEEK